MRWKSQYQKILKSIYQKINIRLPNCSPCSELKLLKTTISNSCLINFSYFKRVNKGCQKLLRLFAKKDVNSMKLIYKLYKFDVKKTRKLERLRLKKEKMLVDYSNIIQPSFPMCPLSKEEDYKRVSLISSGEDSQNVAQSYKSRRNFGYNNSSNCSNLNSPLDPSPGITPKNSIRKRSVSRYPKAINISNRR